MVIAERYELLARIGKGASGSVYRAFDRTLDREVALKLLQPGELEGAEREARVLAKIAHRNVVTIHDFGRSDGLRYLVLELLDGRSFGEWLLDRPSTTELLEVFCEAGRGLAAAHRAGLVHRDFKPSNAILTDEGRVVVIDFGLARDLDGLRDEQQRSEFVEGTLAYMAPERLAGSSSDARSDQFSFCVVLWEALVGRNPFSGADPLARYRAVRRGPQGSSPALDTQLRGILTRGLSFDPCARFESMDDLIVALERPRVAPRRDLQRPLLTALAIAATFVIGWGFAPEAPTLEIAHADYKFLAVMKVVESAREQAEAGEAMLAVDEVASARRMLLELTSEGSAEYCAFGEAVAPLGDVLVENGDYELARLMYATAIRHYEDCGKPTKALFERKMVARSLSLSKSGTKPDDNFPAVPRE
nr:serine/threonine-protein kinase [Pseudenhygromyxa sp. WMMC2535]